ncbi:polysaccharide deacetylase family protein [Thermoflavimicrobium daqui]|uniref:polysaccharide deacetylase family protein n=1 Tax=Thermoflavimicrobium daqui TaxID=2137476 RepID=UPI00143CCE4B|nr:polysaccharide deacetylase family protein [Thermoflavimicrobium daqui]
MKWIRVGITLLLASFFVTACGFNQSSFEDIEAKNMEEKKQASSQPEISKQQQYASGKSEKEKTKETGPLTSKELSHLKKYEKDDVVFNGKRDSEKWVALTFDDGPHPEYTEKILDILQKEKVKATFFLIGQNVKSYPKLVQKELDEGHVIGNHSWDHPFLPGLGKEAATANIEKAKKEIEKAVKKQVTLLRPPYGAVEGIKKELKKSGSVIVNWDVDTNDWREGRTSEQIFEAVKKHVQPGSIILQHDGGGNRSATIQALPKIIRYLKEQGYQFATIDQLLEMRPYIEG